MGKVISYILYDLIRNRVLIAYAFFLFLLSVGMFGLQSHQNKVLVTLLNISLIAIPLMSLVFSTIHFYNSSEFMELLLAQPLPRATILLSQFVALGIALVGAFMLGMGLPILWFSPTEVGVWLIIAGVLVTLVFVALAGMAAVFTKDKTKGIGVVLLLWLYFALLFDSIALLILYSFSDYPIEKTMLGLSLLNPIDLSRLLVLLKMEASALMGLTAAVFREFLGSSKGLWGVLLTMSLWIFIPTRLAVFLFKKKDL